MTTTTPPAEAGEVPMELAADRLGVPSVLFLRDACRGGADRGGGAGHHRIRGTLPIAMGHPGAYLVIAILGVMRG